MSKLKLPKVLESFVSLSVMYGIDLLLPLLMLPFLIRILGIEMVGLINFSTAVISYFALLINYGFNLTATKDVVVCKNNSLQLQKIFNCVTSAKLVLMLVALLLLAILLIVVPKFSEYYYLYIIMFVGVCFQNLFPIWFFQGVQDLKKATIENSVIKLIVLSLVFFLVKEKEDFWIVALLTSISFLLCAIRGYHNIKKLYGIYFSFAPIREVKEQLKKGLYVFLSQFKITFFSSFNVVVLGFLVGNTAVGYFTSADRIIRGLAVIQLPVTNALYPYFSNLVHKNKLEAFRKIKLASWLATAFYLPILLLCYYFSDFLVNIVFGSHEPVVVILLRIMMLLPLLIILNNFFGTQMLLNMEKDRWFFWVLLSTAVINVILVFPLTYYFKEVGTSVSVLISEVYLCIAMYWTFRIAKKTY